MDYNDGHNQAVADAYKSAIAALLRSYTPGRRLAILLPGGMGSELEWSPRPFAGEPIDFAGYEVVWISAGILFRQDGLKLEMDAQQRQADGHLIVPNGPLRFALIPAYDGTGAFFNDIGYNYCVFGFDWRRTIQEAAVNLQSFLMNLQIAVQDRFGEDPLPKTSLICHSQGGLVAKIFLHLPNSLGGVLERVITIATPFYGTATHAQRYFEGDPTLDILYGAPKVAQIVGTLPGPYVLMPMDLATWQKHGAFFGLARYPVLAENGGTADLYDIANMARYPAWVARDYVAGALLVRSTLDRDLPPELLAKVFHLRAESSHTMASFRWTQLPPGYVPGQSPSNFVLDGDAPGGGVVPGDGTVPGFSAALTQAPTTQIRTVPTAQTHQDLGENARFLTAVQGIIETGAIPEDAALEEVRDETYSAADRPKAPPAEVRQFLGDVAAGRVQAGDPRAAESGMARGLVREFLK
jgi:hypothetical protein